MRNNAFSSRSEPCGLTTSSAINQLQNELEETLTAHRLQQQWSIAKLLRLALSHSACSFGFPSCAALLLMQGACVLVMGGVTSTEEAASLSAYQNTRGLAAAVFLAFIVLISAFLQVRFVWLKQTEVARKAERIIAHLRARSSENRDGVDTGKSCPNLYAPVSECVALQWAYRDGNLVNLPCMLLVKGDVVQLRPGRLVHCSCESMGLRRTNYRDGDVYLPEPQLMHHKSDAAVTGLAGRGMVEPQSSLLCRVTETPACRYFATCLDTCQGCSKTSNRPTSVFQAECQTVLHRFLERRVAPVVFLLSLVVCLCRTLIAPQMSGGWVEMLLLQPTLAVLPTLAFSSTILYFFTHACSFAKFVSSVPGLRDSALLTLGCPGKYLAQRNSQPSRDKESAPNLKPWAVGGYFSILTRIMSGDPWLLPFTANAIQYLGNVTGVDVLDKKGVLSYPNPVAEKVFFFGRPQFSTAAEEPEPSLPRVTQSVNDLDAELPDSGTVPATDRTYTSTSGFGGPGALPISKMSRTSMAVNPPNMVILDLTQSQKFTFSQNVVDLGDSHFEVHFDDPSWKQYISNLKPLGLNLMLNSCHLQSAYVPFMDHLHYLSHYVPRTIAVVNRRCLCSLSEAMGFDLVKAREQFEPLNTLSTFRKRPGDPPVPGLQKHRTPLANLFTAFVYDRLTHHVQTFSQGTADLVTESCSFFWDGQDVQKLTRHARKRIDDFYHRYSMTSYCTAFSYSPFLHGIDGGASSNRSLLISRCKGDMGYLEWPKEERVFDPDSFSIQNKRKQAYRRKLGGIFDPRAGSLNRPISLSSESLAVKLLKHPRAEYFPSIANPTDKEPRDGAQEKPSTEVLESCLAQNIFLGMVSLQYQAKPDVVNLVDQLDKACIRFVYFSRENELRSRVFAEKMGLEAGWNCHISLSSEGSQTTIAASETPALGTGGTADGLTAGGLTDKDANKSKSCDLLTKSPSPVARMGQSQLTATILEPIKDFLSSKNKDDQGQTGAADRPESKPRTRTMTLPKDTKFALPAVHFRSQPDTPVESDGRVEEYPGDQDTDTDPREARSRLSRPDNEYTGGSTERSPLLPQPRTHLESDNTYDSDYSGAQMGMDRNDYDNYEYSNYYDRRPDRSPRALGKSGVSSTATSRSSLQSSSSATTGAGGVSMPGNRAKLPKGIENVRPHLAHVDNVPLLVSLFTASSSATTGAGGVSMPGNRAKLPKGIENVRPHLAHVDNVPLLVSLFTDCSAYSVLEMVRIMQENGEVVAVVGSVLNPENVDVFCAASIAIGIEPTMPVICAHDTRYEPVKGTGFDVISPTKDADLSKKSVYGDQKQAHQVKGQWTFSEHLPQCGSCDMASLASIVQSLPTSLQLSRGNLNDIVPVIANARHLLSSIRGSLLYLHSCCLSLALMHVVNTLLPVPPLYTPDNMAFLAVILLPIQAFSLAMAPLPPRRVKLDVSVTKNDHPVNRRAIRGFLLAFLIKFLPTILVTVLLFVLCYLSPCFSADSGLPMAAMSHCESFKSLSFSNSSSSVYPRGFIPPYSWGNLTNSKPMSDHLTICQQATTFFATLSFIALSSGYVYYRYGIRDRKPFRSLAWLCTSILVIILKLLCMAVSLTAVERNFWLSVPIHVWVLGLAWPFVAATLAELYKRTEIRDYNRLQRRRRISFNTKLGMNSPF